MDRQNTRKSSEERAIIFICISEFLLISWIHLWASHIFSNINMSLCIFNILIYILFSCTFIFIHTFLCFSFFFTHFSSYFTFYFIYAHYIINNDNTSVSESPSELPHWTYPSKEAGHSSWLFLEFIDSWLFISNFTPSFQFSSVNQ